ncbi:hydrolase [Sorangium sp. So ce1128]
MSSEPRRDPRTDPLLTPENSALILIDYQPPQVNTIASMDRSTLINNVVTLVKLGKLYRLPIIVSTVNVRTGVNPDTIPQLRDVLGSVCSIDRTQINAWEDSDFASAVKATGRNKLIMAALWTEACLTFPTLDAMREGYEVFPVVDAVGGTSVAAHEMALRRIVPAGAQLSSVIQVMCELQRDWARRATVPGMIQIAKEHGGTFGIQLVLEKEHPGPGGP